MVLSVTVSGQVELRKLVNSNKSHPPSTAAEQELEAEPAPSKSAVKRELAKVGDLARQLTDLAPALRARLPLSEATAEALDAASRMKNRARQRQLRHATAVLARDNVAGIVAALEQLQRPQRQRVGILHDCERWRDGLIAGDLSIIDELAARFDTLDRQHVRRLANQARAELKQDRPAAAARRLFRYLNDLHSAA